MSTHRDAPGQYDEDVDGKADIEPRPGVAAQPARPEVGLQDMLEHHGIRFMSFVVREPLLETSGQLASKHCVRTLSRPVYDRY